MAVVVFTEKCDFFLVMGTKVFEDGGKRRDKKIKVLPGLLTPFSILIEPGANLRKLHNRLPNEKLQVRSTENNF